MCIIIIGGRNYRSWKVTRKRSSWRQTNGLWSKNRNMLRLMKCNWRDWVYALSVVWNIVVSLVIYMQPHHGTVSIFLIFLSLLSVTFDISLFYCCYHLSSDTFYFYYLQSDGFSFLSPSYFQLSYILFLFLIYVFTYINPSYSSCNLARTLFIIR